MEITRQMIDEFNILMSNNGSIIRLEYVEIPPWLESTWVVFRICPSNMLYVDSYILNITDEFYGILKNFFSNKGISLTHNNTRSIFWSNDDLRK